MAPRGNWAVLVLSAMGVILILVGFLALALPSAQEGMQLWQLDSRHSLYLMDVVGLVAIGIGIAFTWLGSQVWKRHVLS